MVATPGDLTSGAEYNRREVLSAVLGALAAPVVAAAIERCASAAPAPTPHAGAAERGLSELLENNRRFDAEYAGGLSNHLSMALVALTRLGASPARLIEYFEEYRKRLEPRPAAASPITADSWRAHLGTHGRYADYFAYFTRELQARGMTSLVTTYLPELLPGLAAAAFHAQIRLAYAIEAGDAGDAAASLAYFADRYLPLGRSKMAAALGDSPLELLRRITRTPSLAGRPRRGGFIFARLKEIAAHPDFAPVLDWMAADDAALGRIAEAAIVLYASTGDFTALHAVTATHALRVLSPLVAARGQAAQYLFQALAAAYISIGTPPLMSDAARRRLERRAAPSWSEIGAAAIGSADEHVIKLVYSCREESRAYKNPLYQHAAARKAGLVDS